MGMSYRKWYYIRDALLEGTLHKTQVFIIIGVVIFKIGLANNEKLKISENSINKSIKELFFATLRDIWQ